MSYKLTNLTFMNRKASLKLVNFYAPESKLTNIYIPNKEQKKFFKNVLKGREKIARGRYQVDDNDLIGGRFVSSKTEFINQDKWVERLIPPRVILNLSRLFDLKFLREARIKKNDKKYNYLSFADSRNDLSDMKLRREIDQTISDFLESVTKVERTLIKDFHKRINKFNKEKIQKIFNSYYAQIQVLSQEYASLELKIKTNELLLTFFQVLWDQIYAFKDLRNSCPCEYNVGKSSNKQLKKVRYKFTYRQPYYVVEKQLKMLNIRISELRVKLFKQRRLVKDVAKQINFEIRKFNEFNEVSKEMQTSIHSQIQNWKKIFYDLTATFEEDQYAIFYETLPSEGKIVAKRIVFLTHQYHTQVLSRSNKIGNKNEFKILKKHYKSEIESIYNQATTWTKEHLGRLNIKFDWYLKNGFKISSINIIYLKILKAINLKKNNIIFLNVFNLLTDNDYESLMKTLKIINQEYPQLTFINFTDNFQAITDWGNKVYSIDTTNRLQLLSPITIARINVKNIRDKLPLSWNLIPYQKVEKGIKIENVFWPIEKLQNSGVNNKLFINPFSISLTEELDVNNQLPLIIKTKFQNRFLDEKMVLGVTTRGTKFIFYAKDPLVINKEFVVFLSPNSIIENF